MVTPCLRRFVALACALGGCTVVAGVASGSKAAVASHADRGNVRTSSGDCGRKRTGRGIAVRMIIRRQGGGVVGGNRYIRYHVHFQTKAYASGSAQFTNLSVLFQDAAGRRQVERDDTRSKLGRPNARRDYAHTTVRVRPGSTVSFRGHVDFYAPGIPLPGNKYLTGEGFPAFCVAR